MKFDTTMGIRRSRFSRFGLATVISLTMGCNLFGQAASGTIVGTVTDQAGAVVAGATVTLLNEGTGFTRTVSANQSGQYAAQFFPIGKVKITVEQPGFQKLVRAGAELTAADTLTVDLQMQVGNIQQTVEVTDAAPVLQTQSQAISSLMTNQQIVEIPLNQRIFTQLIQLMPGATSSTPNPQAGGTYGLLASNSFAVNGSQSSNNSYLIDGLYNRGLWLNNLTIVPPIDGLQEVRVMASSYTAEFGAAAGAVTLAYSKSGSNQYHGSVYEYLQNDKLNANTFFNNRSGIAKTAFRKNLFGATAGGPIRRDKTFFFADYQGNRVATPSVNTLTIPTTALDNMVRTGDFSAFGTPVYNPYSTTTASTGATVRNAFANNQIPVSLIDPVAVKLLNLLPTPNAPGTTRNYTYSPTSTQQLDQFDVRADQNLFASDRLFVKYSFMDANSLQPGNMPSPASPGVPIGPYIGGGGTNVLYHNWSATANYTRVVSPNVVNETRVGALRWFNNVIPPDSAYNTAAALGIPNININDNAGGLPGFTINGGYAVIGDSATYPEYSRTISFQYEDILTVVRGSHTFKFGGLFIRHRLDGFSGYPTRGNYTFTGQFTSQIGSPNAKTALPDFALGAASTIVRAELPGTFGMRFFDAAAFADDTWRLNNRLTINLGLRYEVQSSPYEVYDRWSNFNVVTGKLILPNTDGLGRSLRKNDLNNLAPRVGVAYSADSKTVFRAGFGMTYVEDYNVGNQLYKNLPNYFNQTYSYDAGGAPGLLISNGIPLPVAPALTDIGALSAGNPMAYDLNTRLAKQLQWSFGIQRQILPELALEVDYIGSRGENILAPVDINQAYPGAGAVQNRRPLCVSGVNCLVGDVRYASNIGDSKYHSLQSKLTTRSWHGFTSSVSYTWSHYLIDVGQLTGGALTQDARCYACNWGNAPEDRRHVVVINHVYDLPFGRGKAYLSTGWLGRVVGGWQVSGVWTLETGSHFTPTLATAVSNTAGNGTGAERANRIANGNLPSSQRTIDRWFDLSAFTIPQQYTFGNAAPYILEGPGYIGSDVGIHRVFEVFERAKLTFRWEMFNALNRVNFSNPNSSIGGSTAGQISGTQPARTMQLGLKATF